MTGQSFSPNLRKRGKSHHFFFCFFGCHVMACVMQNNKWVAILDALFSLDSFQNTGKTTVKRNLVCIKFLHLSSTLCTRRQSRRRFRGSNLRNPPAVSEQIYLPYFFGKYYFRLFHCLFDLVHNYTLLEIVNDYAPSNRKFLCLLYTNSKIFFLNTRKVLIPLFVCPLFNFHSVSPM